MIIKSIFEEEWIIDRVAREWLGSGVHHPWLDSFFSIITQLGSPTAFFIWSGLSLMLLMIYRYRLEGIFLNLCLLTSWAVMHYLKLCFGRFRPPGEALTYASGFSFPSGHAMVSMAFYGFVAFLILDMYGGVLSRVGVVLIYLMIVLIGISRVYLNVHYATDILAGYLLGGLILVMFISLLRWTRRKWGVCWD
ncbi:phosphatase PAP2 family protein [Syntrophomonas erecta]